jgi:glyoxylase-like metal-dependent hydrolase (beta-lactamase superfamily II)
MREVDRMADLAVDYVLPGHGPVIQGEAAVGRNYEDIRAMFG